MTFLCSFLCSTYSVVIAFKAEDKKRKKKKPKLDMHDQQLFIDGPDVSLFCSLTNSRDFVGIYVKQQ